MLKRLDIVGSFGDEYFKLSEKLSGKISFRNKKFKREFRRNLETWYNTHMMRQESQINWQVTEFNKFTYKEYSIWNYEKDILENEYKKLIKSEQRIKKINSIFK